MGALEDAGKNSALRLDELATLYRLTDGLYRAQSLTEAFDAALDGIVAALGGRASILLFDKSGVMRFVAWRGLSDSYRTRLEGHSPWNQDDVGAEPILVRDIEETDEATWIKSAVAEEGIRALAFIPIISGQRVIGKFMTYYAGVHEFSASETRLAIAIARQIGFSVERDRAEAARRAAEGELRESEERFRLMSELAPVMIWTSDAQGRCLHLNRLLREFWGVDNIDLAEFDWQSTMHPQDAAQIGASMGAAVEGQKTVVIEGRYKRYDGAYRVLRTDARPRFARDGTFLGMIGVNVDVTEERLSAERLAVMVAELQHRTRNLIAVIQSIANQTIRSSRDLDSFRHSFAERLGALSRVQGLLSRSEVEPITVDAIVDQELNALNANDKVSISGPKVRLDNAVVQMLALALHELATNARKHGALTTADGRIAVSWDTRAVPLGGPALTLRWLETGIGHVAPGPPASGFGRALIENALAYSLGARTSFNLADGRLRCTIELPLTGEA